VRSIRYHSEARTEFLNQVDYYASLSVRLAERFDRAVVAAETLAAETPDHWPPYKHKTRRVLDRQFKFSLVYLHTDREIVVIAIAPFRRRPSYWKGRIGDG